MKKLFTLIILFLAMILLSGYIKHVNSAKGDLPEDVVDNKELIDNNELSDGNEEIQLVYNDKLLLEIKQAYLNKYYNDQETDKDVEMYVEEYFGIYNNKCVVAMIAFHSTNHFQIMWQETIAGETIYYNNNNYIIVYKGNEFYKLSEAFEKGLLNVEDIKIIAYMHNEREFISVTNKR